MKVNVLQIFILLRNVVKVQNLDDVFISTLYQPFLFPKQKRYPFCIVAVVIFATASVH